jgi:prophage tail gpP-like protein
MADVRLRLGANDYGGWKDVRIQRSIEQIAGKFSLALTERWAGQDVPRPIRPGAECQVLIDGTPVITGYVDDVQIDYSANDHTVSATGRDKTGDLVDCSAPNKDKQRFNVTLLGLAKKLCAPYGIEVTADVDVGPAFISTTDDSGASVFEALNAAAAIRAVLFVSDGLGGLLITRASELSIQAVLRLGENVLACSALFTHLDRYRDYTVYGQQPGTDNTYSTDASEPHASTRDEFVTRHRPLTLIAEKRIDLAAAKVRAEWERNVRFGKSQRIQYTVQGWHHAPGELWPINRLVTVRDDYIGIDASLLITGVTFILDASGMRTELVVMPREAYLLVPLPEDDAWENL